MHGIHTALVTPFAADGAVDLTAYAALCGRQLDAGIHGLVPCGTTGEAATLTHDEWRACIETAVRVSDGRVPVTAGVGTNNTASTVANLEAAAAAGATAGLLVFPYYNKPNPDGLREHVRRSARVGLPLVLYHVPGRTAQHLPAGLLAGLANVDGVIAVKEATGDLRYGTDVIRRTEASILSGDDFTFLPLLAAGGTGCISVVSNVAPAQTVAVYDRFEAGDLDGARGQLMALWPLIEFLFCDSNPVPCKAALATLGHCGAQPRLPLAPFSGTVPSDLLHELLG